MDDLSVVVDDESRPLQATYIPRTGEAIDIPPAYQPSPIGDPGESSSSSTLHLDGKCQSGNAYIRSALAAKQGFQFAQPHADIVARLGALIAR
ncbi:hypothetical protein CGCF415_v006744 [Colletotrichum fructicola]|uniref:Uncharacterized protein n=1 Tax=Colletotrichum fructicola (strain Nara gc5) TaxID=1213859 RepID=A0A7J6J286_COLFN|nr:hypothetical protein CGGC5_v009788 [Colletotrichum fructicola Nara gc5]KAF4892948.1 hypothetical protein CGCFRS4_v007316 [Colletotrichum fructicola]KAF4908434.1 hypothetical protein CGCF415_v006744 [Colletotrichum fructicola]KAF4932783.1 hypothetical protein CGCF245_v010190 [Colletotrichum fructicola]